jgi:hypothetical protein
LRQPVAEWRSSMLAGESGIAVFLAHRMQGDKQG